MEVDGHAGPATMRGMKERPTSGTLLSRRFGLVLLHLAEEARHDLDSLVTNPVRAVHSLRTRMKNLRSLLQLVKPRISKPERKAVHALARALKDAFAVLRDAHVLAALRSKLTGRQISVPKEKMTPQVVKRNKAAKADASRLIRTVSNLGLDGLTWAEVTEEYLQSYRAGRKAMKACKGNPTSGTFHKWRRPVKELFYQSRVLQPLDGMRARRRSAERLGDRLGALHDLHLLHGEAKKSRMPDVMKQIAKKQRALKPAIFKAAAKLFDERPRDIERELKRCVKFQPAIVAQAVRQT
jgi:hypothetical protein